MISHPVQLFQKRKEKSKRFRKAVHTVLMGTMYRISWLIFVISFPAYFINFFDVMRIREQVSFHTSIPYERKTKVLKLRWVLFQFNP